MVIGWNYPMYLLNYDLFVDRNDHNTVQSVTAVFWLGRWCVRDTNASLVLKFELNKESLPPRPITVWRKVIFSVACVKNSVHGGGVCLSACWDTTPPPQEQAPPCAVVLGAMVNKRAVCIPLECNLLLPYFTCCDLNHAEVCWLCMFLWPTMGSWYD